MSQLTDKRVVEIAEACLMLPFYGSALSAFEVDLVAELGRRFRAAGRAAVATDAEWQVFDAGLDAMRADRARRAGLAKVAA